MVDSKAGGVAVGGLQGTANAGASEFSGANFTYVVINQGASYNWTAAVASSAADSTLANLCKWVSQKATIVAVNAVSGGKVYMICEGPFGWGTSSDMQTSIRASIANGGLAATGLVDGAASPAAVTMAAAVPAVTTALALA